ncbi:DUF3311 domain-containing protein [Brevundimonas naejangsanensis]|uniref:DUF3311 domain-containing protein n=1 Tax=Brevundimonas naejangsanensis TaxID=588932 RepID=UPI0004083F23|nr:DUF3311 domain-containing protein [Brevundimonas naejangsanensis]
MSQYASFRAMHRRYVHRWLLVIPFIWQIGLTPLVNTASVRVFSLPLPMAWQMAGILVATAVIGFVFWRDERIEKELGLTDDQDGEGLS